MSKYVPDIKTKRWVVIAPKRIERPGHQTAPGFAETIQKPTCPFCAGNESLTPPEVYRVGSGEKDQPGWLVRVVPNKFPITDIHEVIIHSPNDVDDLEKLSLVQVAKVITVYRDRFRAHENDGQVLIFCNHGVHAGASLTHPHSQLVVVPAQITLDAVSLEPINNIVEDNTYFVTYCPDFSQWPFEVWIAPKEIGKNFGDLTDVEIPDLAKVLQTALRKIEKIYIDPNLSHLHAGVQFGYNFYIYHGTNWFIRIIPRFIHRAGFELGTGLNVNVVDPSEAAEILKNVS